MSDSLNKTHTDIKRFAWIEAIPPRIRPYIYLMRLDRPIGIWLLLLPGLWGIALGSQGFTHQSFKAMILFIIGATIMRGAGCVMNDLWDRDLDKMVERTRNRPIASGAVSPKQALLFLLGLLICALIIVLQYNLFTIILAFASLPLIATYPLMKRITWWPQAFLGITFNFSALMGYSAMTGTLDLPVLFLYLAGIFWTIGYDTIYAHQDKEDDIMAGIKSTARLFDQNSKFWVSGFYGLCILCLAASFITQSGIHISLLLTAIPALHFIWQIKNWNADDQESSLRAFKSNYKTGLLILFALITGSM